MAEVAFKPFVPAEFSRDEALCNWMRQFIRKFGGLLLRVQFQKQGGSPAIGNTPAVEPTAFRVNIFTDRTGPARNGVSFTAGTILDLSTAINIEAPKFNRRTIRR